MVVCDSGNPELTALVNIRLPDAQGRKRVPYADFLENPAIYGRFCIEVD